MKLSKTMQAVLDHAKCDIDLARKLNYPEWLMATNHCFQNTDSEYWQKQYKKALAEEYLKKYWEMHRNAEVLTHCSSHTIRALEKRGLIEIIEDSVETGGSIDVVKILNY